MQASNPHPLTSKAEMETKGPSPLVSVVMPNHNKARFIGAAIESVLGQTMGNLELIIVDDASTDASAEIAKGYAKNDSRISLIRHEETRGVSAARNTGIRHAKGNVIGFIDSDDIYAPEKLERQLSVLERSEVPSVVYCDYWQIGEDGKELPPSRWPVYKKSGMIFGDVLQDKFGIKTTILLAKECLQRVGFFDESLPFSEDLDMILRLSWLYPFVLIDEKLYSYRIFPGNTKNRLAQTSLSLYRASVIEKHFKQAMATLTAEQKRAVVLRLTILYGRSRQRRKMVRYGLKSYGSFKYLLAAPFRGHGLSRLYR